MSVLNLTLTAAGYAAFVNPANTGTNAIVVAQVGVTAAAFVPDSGMAALPGEIKRLSTIAGAVVADNTMHVTIQDSTADSYSLRGFGLYSDAGVLLALFGQAAVILEKSTQATMLLSADMMFTNPIAAEVVFGDSTFSNPPATTTVQGVVALATPEEGITGTDPARAMTPSTTKAVLDNRFGVGAPSAFVKPLLALATAVLIRAALEIKSAALKDEGANNGLDADKLDGQHGAYYLAWANQTGRPSTFPPSAHGHAWSDISLITIPDTAIRWPTWGEVTDKPLTFTPSGHSHDAGHIVTGTFANARVAQSNVTQHQAALSITWGQVIGKPATFPPSGHTHAIGDVTDLATQLASKAALAGAAFTGAVSAPGFSVSSTRRIKQDIVAFDAAASLVDQFQPVTFRYIGRDLEHVGLIAEDVALLVPQAVMLDAEGNPQSIDYGQLVPVLISVMQQVCADMRDVRNRMDAIEAQVA